MDDRVSMYLADVQKLGHPSAYQTWKIKMKHVLLLADLWHLVDPAQEPAPNKSVARAHAHADADADACVVESRKALATAILRSAVTHPTKKLISRIREPRQCWLALQNHFAPDTVARRFSLYRRLVSLKMREGEPFDLFFHQFAKLKRGLEDAGKVFHDEELVFMVLHALPSTWNGFVRNCVAAERFKRHSVSELCTRIRAEEQWMGVLTKLNAVKKLSLS